MNQTIILSQLSETIARLTQSSPADAEAFIRELTALIAQRLEAYSEAEVPGLGRFAVADDRVIFSAADDLAETINAPFAAFSPVELEEADLIVEDKNSDEAEIAQAAEFEEAADSLPQECIQPVRDEPPMTESVPPRIQEPTASTESPLEPDEPETPGRPTRTAWPWWLIACIVCFIGGYFLGQRDPEPKAEPHTPIQEETIETPAPQADSVITETAANPTVTDTIGSFKFLTTMARKHYGHMDFWPYIYEANADRLGNPDKVAAGTVVVIPSGDSLNLDPKNPEQLRVAKQKAAEIYARFNSR